MKIIIPVLLTLVAALMAVAPGQCQKHDRHWLGEDDSLRPVFMRFDSGGLTFLQSADTSKLVIFRGCFAISNAEGELQFYTNGNAIASWDNRVMQNGTDLNLDSPPYGTNGTNGTNPFSYPVYSNYLPYTYSVIPDAYDEDVYYLLHNHTNIYDLGDIALISSTKMKITKIDMSLNGGRGRVIYKSRVIDEELTAPTFVLIRHGNGRDWWLVQRSRLDGLEYKALLLHRDEVIQKVRSPIPGLSSDWFTEWDWAFTANDPMYASPDGNLLVDKYGVSYAKLLAFDRCSGEVTLLDTIDTGFFTLDMGGGIWYLAGMLSFQVSPSGRYLYGASDREVAQWDLEAEDITASKVTLGGTPWPIDETQNVLVGGLGGVMTFGVGLDGKIYNLYSWTHSVIEHPEERGEAAGVCLAADNPPSCVGVPYQLFSHPYPNYRLGPLAGSACDTLPEEPVSPPTGDYEVRISPTPTSGQVTIEVALPEYESGTAVIEVTDMLGRILYRHRFPPYAYIHQLDATAWAAGVYNVVLRHKNKLRTTGRMVVGIGN